MTVSCVYKAMHNYSETINYIIFVAPPMLQNTFKEFSDSFSAGKETMVDLYQLQLTLILLMILSNFNSAGKSILLGSLRVNIDTSCRFCNSVSILH